VAEASDGRIVAINARFLELIGWHEPYSGQPLDDLISAWMSRAGNPQEIEDFFCLSRSGKQDGAMELHPNQGQMIEARSQLAQADNAISFRIWFFQEWKTSALAWVSHEIKNPLNAVLGFSELLAESLAAEQQPEAVKSALRGLRIGTKHLQSVLGDLLDLSRYESGVVETRPEWVDLNQFLGDIDALFRTRFRRRGLEFVVEQTSSPDREIWTDPGRLTQILGNLLSNSLKFTKRGWVALRVRNDGSTWEFVVEDTGVGIPLEQQKRIFEPFVQERNQDSRYGGTGLGLAICRTLAGNLNGQLDLVSEPGQGSRFLLTLSNVVSRLAEGASAKTGPANLSGISLLIADDEMTNHLLVQDFLRAENLTILEASNGFQAIEVWKEKHPALILMDLRMPGLSGLEAARRIRALDPGETTKLLAMSATKPTPAEQSDGSNLWAGFLEKPFRKGDLVKFLSNHLPE